jgi:hypothetical protein
MDRFPLLSSIIVFMGRWLLFPLLRLGLFLIFAAGVATPKGQPLHFFKDRSTLKSNII